MDVSFVALNLIVIVAIGLGFVVARLLGRRSNRAETPTSTQPDTDEQELTDAVTEWAKATGLLDADERQHDPTSDRRG